MDAFPFCTSCILRPAFCQRNLEQPHGFPCLSSQGICNTAQKSQSILHFCPYPLLFLTHSLPISHYGTIREIGISTFGLSSCAHTCLQVYFLLHIHQPEMVQKLLKKKSRSLNLRRFKVSVLRSQKIHLKSYLI